jgi:hypothetical protein
MQRWAAKELAVSPSAHKVKPSSKKNSCPSPEKKLPVLPPSTFILENFDAKEWITVTRRERKKQAAWP